MRTLGACSYWVQVVGDEEVKEARERFGGTEHVGELLYVEVRVRRRGTHAYF